MSTALYFRRKWMTMLGLSPGEIDSACLPDVEYDLGEEVQEYQVMLRIQQLNAKSDLLKLLKINDNKVVLV